nr:unnamed protein product [Digitaria exilis]
MAQRERDEEIAVKQGTEALKHGRAHTKVSGDDEMLRTGFHNGTPLEGGKIADSEPVDLFAPANRVAQQATTNHHQQQQQQQEDEDEEDKPDAAGPATVVGRQGMAPHVAGGRRLGRQ